MKRWIGFLTIFIGVLVFSGCQLNTQTTQDTKQVSDEQTKTRVTIKLNDMGKEITSQKIWYQSNDTLLQTLKNHFNVEEKNGFITSIENHAQDTNKNKYWTFTINGKMSEKGANEIKLKNKDQVVFDLNEFKK